MKKLLVAAAALLTLSLGGTASAADLRPAYKAPPPPPAPVYNWTGCYLAGGFGYGMYDINHSVTHPVTGATFDTGHDNGGRGWIGTVGVGCDVQFSGFFGGGMVFGVFADYDWSGIKGTYSYNCPGGCAGPTGFNGELKERSAWYVGGRLGFLVTPNLLSYVSGGWTQARFGDATLIDASGVTTTAVVLGSQTRSGWFIGGGAEYGLGWFPGLFWRSEYRFADYRNVDQFAVCVTGPGCAVGTLHAFDHSHTYVQTVRSELVFRFNWGSGVVARY